MSSNSNKEHEQEMERYYSFLIADIMVFIDKIKKLDTKKENGLLDIIYEYCLKNDIEVELMGDAIASDVYFKSFIQKDCEDRNIIKSNNTPIEEW
jgi:hypothetical protein